MLLRFLVILAIGYAALCLVVYLTQAKLVYFPGREPRATPADFGLEFRELQLRTKDGVGLHGWFLPVEGARGAVLVSHGNAGTIELRIELARSFVELGWSVLLYDYRGYGKSAGEPDEEGTYRDAEAAFDWLVRERGLPPARIAAWGESLGGAVALEFALRRLVGALVLESAFTSLADIGSSAYPFLPVRLLARSRYDTRACIARLDVPVLVVHGSGDEIVPFDHARSLVAAARRTPELIEFAGGHNDKGWLEHPPSRARVKAFLDAALRAAK
jgi:fermentation-respiration switch protein FrsA (DUF1100 family)